MRVTMVLFGDLAFDFRVYREARTLADAGHAVRLVVGDFSTAELPAAWSAFQLQRLPVDRALSLRRSYPAFWRWAAAAATTTAADVVHAHDLDALWPAARAARRLSARLVYDAHELFTEQSSLVTRPAVRAFWRWWERRWLRRVDRVVTVSGAIAEDLQARYRLPRPPAVVRNLPPFREPVPSPRLRQALGLVDDPVPLALYQGGFLADNGLREVVAAMAHVDAGRLVLLGGGPTEDALRRQVRDAGLEDRVRFLPRVPFPQLHEWTCGADLGICVIKPTGHSFAWSLPNKLFEYFIAGLPVLAGDTPQIRQVIEATGAGLVVDPLDPAAIAAGLQALLADAGRRARLATAAAAAALRHCWEEEAPRLLAVYDGLAGEDR